jgi:hypothetical protein
MKKLHMTRRGVVAWAQWRSRRLHRSTATEECERCAYLEARVAGLLAELEACGSGERVVVVWRDRDVTPGGRVGAFINRLLASFKNHRVVWAFIGTVVFGVLGFIVYKSVILWMNG